MMINLESEYSKKIMHEKGRVIAGPAADVFQTNESLMAPVFFAPCRDNVQPAAFAVNPDLTNLRDFVR
jgi:hypothetical protein